MTDASPVTFCFNSDAQVRGHYDRHRLRILLGGVGSGKTILVVPSLIELSGNPFEVNQLHGVFTNTQKQLDAAVLFEIRRWLPLAGINIEFDRKPPKQWFRRWARDNVEIPPVMKYRGILTLSTGLHVMLGTLFQQNFTQYQSIQFSTLRVEEFPNLSLAALQFMLERLRCGMGREVCRKHHRHQATVVGNPPLGGHPFLYTWLDQLEESAGRSYDGPALDHRSWPLLKRGFGDAILIGSRTADNASNLSVGYEVSLAAGYTKDAARRRLDGEILREVGGRAYSEFSSNVIRRVEYNPDRTLYLGIDFNVEPRVCVMAHPLSEGTGEIPAEYEGKRLKHIGVFGEFFSLGGGMGDRRFAEALVRGDRGVGDCGYPSEALRGLPANWRGLKEHHAQIIAYGDAVGTHRSVHADNLESSWQIIDGVLRELRGSNGIRYLRSVPATNPPPRARVDSVNAKFRSALDQPSLWIDPRCLQLIRDFEQVMWDEDGASIREWRRGGSGGALEWHRTHESDALGYLIHQLSPLGVDHDPMANLPRVFRRKDPEKPPSFL